MVGFALEVMGAQHGYAIARRSGETRSLPRMRSPAASQSMPVDLTCMMVLE